MFASLSAGQRRFVIFGSALLVVFAAVGLIRRGR